MKRWNFKSFVAGALLMALVMGLGVPALASSTVMKELYYNNIQIRLNGKTIVPKDASGNVVEPFVIDGTTYLPIRAVASALGLNVEWDGKNQTVILGNDPEKGVPAKWLGEMEPFTGSAYENTVTNQQYDDNSTANNGDTYDRYYGIGDKGVSYLLKGQYTKLTGTWYLHRPNKDMWEMCRFLIYCDGELTYTSPTMTAGVEPISLNIPTAGCYELKIVPQCSRDKGQSWLDGASYPTFIANAALWTN